MSELIEDKEFWQNHLEKLKISGLSRFQYCRENDINYDRFGYWLKKLSPPISKFISVKLQASDVKAEHATLCTIELRGHVLKIHDLSALSLMLERLA